MGTHALGWLVNQYRCVLGRMRAHEYRQAHPALAGGPGGDGAAAALRRRFQRMKVERLEDRVLLSGGLNAAVQSTADPEIDDTPGEKVLNDIWGALNSFILSSPPRSSPRNTPPRGPSPSAGILSRTRSSSRTLPRSPSTPARATTT